MCLAQGRNAVPLVRLKHANPRTQVKPSITEPPCSSSHLVNLSYVINRGSYMSAHVLLNLLNELGKRDKMRGLPSILSLFRNEFNKFNIQEHEC